MLTRILFKRIRPRRNTRFFATKKIAVLRNINYDNTIFHQLKLENVLNNKKGLEDGYDFQPAELSYPIIKNDEIVGYTEPMKIPFASYDAKLHLSHKKYINNEIYNIANIGKKGNIDFCDFINSQILSSHFDKIVMYHIFC